jgi:hypothetical protein
MPENIVPFLADAMHVGLAQIRLGLNDPDYNFFIHTAPLENHKTDPHQFYTWHVDTIHIVHKNNHRFYPRQSLP